MHSQWFSKRKPWLWWGGLIFLGLGALIVLVGGYLFHWGWTGFDKTLWDWMQLLIVPAALAVASFLFTRAEHRRDGRSQGK